MDGGTIEDRETVAFKGSVLETLAHPVLVFDGSGKVTYANAAGQASLGGWIVGLNFVDLFPEAPEPFARLADARGSHVVVCKAQSRFTMIFGAASSYGLAVSLFPCPEPTATLTIETDELTGLRKRQALSSALELALDGTAWQSVALHCLDLDRFKIVNDTLGHGIGDLLLKKVADRIRSVCRKDDCVARIGGDEFVVLQNNVGQPADAEKLAARLVDLVGRTYVLSGHTVNVSASVGVALSYPGAGARDLLRNGDLALLEAKRAGRSRYRTFEPAMDAALRERRELETELRRALALKQFELHYQPFLDLGTDRVIGFEALIRWEHPTKGRISPIDFIPMAEETGLIVKIGEWVLNTACTTAMSWPDPISVAVNVSPVQFQSDGLIDAVTTALARSGLPPHRLEIEITEGALLDNTDSVLATLHALRDLGIQISMDDFGTGYSSLSYLQKFPFNKIKIDRSFVQAAEAGGDNEAILKAIAGLGVSLGMAITAEGVETAEQLDLIRSEHCTHVQGYLTGRPVPSSRVSDFLP